MRKHSFDNIFVPVVIVTIVLYGVWLRDFLLDFETNYILFNWIVNPKTGFTFISLLNLGIKKGVLMLW